MGVNRLIVFLIFIYPLGACFNAYSSTEEEMYTLASALTKLSASVESTVRYKNPPKDISDRDLLILATKHDPSLLAPFEKYALLVKSESRHAIVLVCTSSKSHALLEDAGCSAKLDAHPWQGEENCAFTLNLNLVCPSIK